MRGARRVRVSRVALGTLTGVGLKLSIIQHERSKCRRIHVVVRAVRLCSLLRVRGVQRPRVRVISGLSFLPMGRGGLICGTTQLLRRRFTLASKVSMGLAGEVPMTTKVTKKDASTTTVLCTVGRLCSLKLSHERLVGEKMRVKTSIPCYLVHKATLTRKVKRGLARLPPVVGYPILVTGPSVSMSAGFMCRGLGLSRRAGRPSVSTLVGSVQRGSFSNIYTRVKGMLRSIAVPGCPMVTRVGRRVVHSNTGTSVVDKDNPAMFNLFRSKRATGHTLQRVGHSNLTGRMCLAAVCGGEEGWWFARARVRAVA